MKRQWKKWKYKQLTYFFVSILIVFVLIKIPMVHALMHELSRAGYVGAFVGGMLYVSALTSALGALLLLAMLESVEIMELSILAGVGGLVGDLILFRYIRSGIHAELTHIYNRVGGKGITRTFKRTPVLNWIVPIIGMIIIASPFPDEIGISMLGFSQIKTVHFAVVALILDIVGVYALLHITSQI